MNVKLIVVYDGTYYFGWQKVSFGPSIEGCLQDVLTHILQHDVVLQAASRTDAGVHAAGQVVNFFTFKDIDEKKLLYGLNALLPKDIRILSLTIVEDHFHPTLNSIGKTYHYQLCQGAIQLPQHRLYSWHIPQSLHLAEMHKAADLLIGEHDFSAFCNVKSKETYKDKIRHLRTIEFVEIAKHRMCIILNGNNFLYKMARNLVGTLVYVGLGKIELSDVAKILKSKDRRTAGVSAPAHGLSLFKVLYNN